MLAVKKYVKLPKAMQGLMPVMVIPVLVTAVASVLMFTVVGQPFAWLQVTLTEAISSLQSGSKFVFGAVLGGMACFDFGGPVNKTASMAANALGADGINGPMCAKIIGGMTPPIGLFIATMIRKNKFTRTELETAKTALPMGLCFITEGVLPFAAADPARFIPSSMAGSAVAGAIAVGMGCESVAGHGGIFVVPMMKNPVWFMIALVIGSAVTGIIYALIKKPSMDETAAEEEDIDIDLDIRIE